MRPRDLGLTFAAAVATALAAALVARLAVAADPPPLFRHRAPIAIEQPGAFVKLPLPASAFEKSTSADLRDLRVVDARGERVSFALLAPRPDETRTGELLRDTTLYPLPPRPAGDAPWPSPIDVAVEGERITVRRRGGAPTTPSRSPGWLIDLGESRKDEPPPQALRLQWSGPAEFSVGYAFETSADLRQWQRGGAGQVMALASPAGALAQREVTLGAAPARFVRLVWTDASNAPQLVAAQAVSPTRRSVSVDPPTEMVLGTSAPPPGKLPTDDDARRALHYDLGAPLPLVQVDLRLPGGTVVVPARLQVRNTADQPWQPLAAAVFYRLERDGSVATSPAVAVQRTARYLRVVPDERAATPDPSQTRLVAHVQLTSLVFAAQGAPPYALLAGADKAEAGALPLATLVPALDEERARFGRATLGAWTEQTDAARQAEVRQRQAALRPWLLWAVLALGVAGLGRMVWRLARGKTQTDG